MRLTPLLFLLAACPAPKDEDTASADPAGADTADTGATDDTGETDETGETGETGDTEDTADTAEQVCGITVSEDWAFYGQCPRMRTPFELWVIDADACTFEITYNSGMTMGMPWGVTVSGSDLIFDDGDDLTGCVGTLEDPENGSGTCDGGCSFTMALD